MAGDGHGGQKKIQCWIPLSMWEQLESNGYISPTHAVMKSFELLLENVRDDIRESQTKDLGYSKDFIEFSEIPKLKARIEEKEQHIETLKKELENISQMHNNYMVQMQTLINQKAIEVPGAKKPWWRFW
jgi:molecular chaperone GrpE (heat shock protein)